LWHPFATIEFPADACAAGLKTFQKLREYRRLHELSWPSELCLDEDGKKLRRRERGRKICDQKANSVADMSAALKNVTARENVKGEEKAVVEPVVTAKISWADILDAEFAESWPETVVHGKWETTRNNRKQRAEAVLKQVEETRVKKHGEVMPPPEIQRDGLGRIIL
jgi:Transcriptional regulation of mitochondrial recombination